MTMPFKNIILPVCLLMLVSGCALITPVPESSMPVETPVEESEGPIVLPEEKSPRLVASLRLTEQGRILIESRKPDQAVRILERGVILDPDNGRNYFYLSEAWLLKGDISQAIEFNRLASMYLREDIDWARRVEDQRKRIEDLTINSD